jgi:hypothetical protein
MNLPAYFFNIVNLLCRSRHKRRLCFQHRKWLQCFWSCLSNQFKRLFYYDSKGINVVCSCDNNEYSLFTGLSQGGSQYPLKQYRVEVNGTILRVYNWLQLTYGEHEYSRQNKCGALANQIIRIIVFLSCYPIDYLLTVQTRKRYSW